jgi:hypothetical protein
MNQALLTDLIVFGIACGAYLQYKSVKTIAEVPSQSERRSQGLSRAEMIKTIEGLAYAVLGIVFETLCISKAVFG